MATSQQEKIITGLRGEFSVAVKLCEMNYYPSLTLKNYPGIDIFVLNPVNKKQVAIQVKSLRKEKGKLFYVPEKVDEMDIVFVFVYIHSDHLDYFIVSSKDVAQLSYKVREDYIKNNPQVNKKQPRMIGISEIECFKDKWELLGLN